MVKGRQNGRRGGRCRPPSAVAPSAKRRGCAARAQSVVFFGSRRLPKAHLLVHDVHADRHHALEGVLKLQEAEAGRLLLLLLLLGVLLLRGLLLLLLIGLLLLHLLRRRGRGLLVIHLHGVAMSYRNTT